MERKLIVRKTIRANLIRSISVLLHLASRLIRDLKHSAFLNNHLPIATGTIAPVVNVKWESHGPTGKSKNWMPVSLVSQVNLNCSGTRDSRTYLSPEACLLFSGW